jgi:hypothetical protein
MQYLELLVYKRACRTRAPVSFVYESRFRSLLQPFFLSDLLVHMCIASS